MIGKYKTDKKNNPKSSKHINEIIGVISIFGSLYLLLSLITYNKWDTSLLTFSNLPIKNYGGIIGSYISDAIFSLVGKGGYIIPIFLFIYGLKRLLGREKFRLHLIGSILSVISLSFFFNLVSWTINSQINNPGGFIGYILSSVSIKFLSIIGAYILNIAFILISLILISPVSIFSYIMNIKKTKKIKTKDPEILEGELLITNYQENEKKEIIKEKDTQSQPQISFFEHIPDKKGDGYIIPSLDFLKDPEVSYTSSKDDLSITASVLEKKLSDFNVTGKIKQAHPGPVVTMYEFEPAPGIKINRIVSLSEDLALALKAPSIRVYPIAGKATIGIEVPNKQKVIVSLKEIIGSESFQKSHSLLTLALGKDIFGNPVVTDLSRLPHLLVAGTTGSGKSVFMNTMIISLLYKATPDEIKMLMIDPKFLELSAYADIPHLLSPVITDPKEASDAMKKVVFEMERRYKLLSEKGVRNIETFNKQVPKSDRLPYIVVFIDELADLMLTAPKDVENAITRLAQMARASGIHLILATQRPSVDVITGLIKANFPARISFQVTSKIDSRTILDSMGAEQLLGMGDMLFMVPGAKIVRIHGAYVSEEEIKPITDFVRSQGKPEYSTFENIIIEDSVAKSPGESEERDEMYQQVIDFASSIGEVSISSIQRRFKIGYNKAARIMEFLEEDGLVGPPRGAGKPRDFLGRR